jgi:GNAT superfamily N-acetyltransferase
MVKELRHDEFTDRLEPIFRSVELRLPSHLQGRKSEYFFPEWQNLMRLGIARAWEIPNAVLGCLFSPDIFSGTRLANVVFWFSIPETKGTLQLLDAAIAAARHAGCRRISIAAYGSLEGERIAEIYRHLGFVETERIFQKELR